MIYSKTMKKVVKKTLSFLKPPDDLAPTEWAERHIKIPAGNKISGMIRFDNAPYQREPLDMIINPKCRRITLMWSAQVGKELCIKTPIPTTKGWRAMGDLCVGDYVYGSDGKPAKITYISPIRDNSKQYEITFTDGSTIKACENHQWKVDIITSEGIKAKDVVLCTKDMLGNYKSKGRYRYCINNTKPIENEPTEFSVDPYTLGFWLGDGEANSGAIYLADQDREAIDYIPYAVKNDNHKHQKGCSKITFSGLHKSLRELGVLKNKHIPKEYLFNASEFQRAELLRGLMDSDGTSGYKNGRPNTFEICLSNKLLAHDVYSLVCSLGIKCSFKKSNSYLYGKRKKDRYRIGFTSYSNTIMPFKLSRYVEHIKPTKDDNRHCETMRRRIVDIKPIESVPMRCISVDNYDNTYLAGSQMVPTHNTMIMQCGQAYFIAQRPCSQMMMQPSGSDVKTWLETKFNPMIQNNELLSELVAKPRGRDGVNNQQMKSYAGGWFMLAYSGSPKTMRGRSAPKIWCDEIDGYERTVEGDAVNLLWQRAATFGDQRLLVETSTPTIKGLSAIETAFENGDRRYYWIPCPHCNTYQRLHWKNVEWDSEGKKHFPETARYICEHCKKHITDGQKIAALRKGEWRSEDTFTGHASFHLSELYSAFRKWSDIVESFLEKKAKNDLQSFVNLSLAETWDSEEGEQISDAQLYNRREYYQAELPVENCVLTAAVDTQDDRFEINVVAWIAGEQCYNVSYERIYGDLSRPEIWNVLAKKLRRQFYAADGTPHDIRLVCIDSGGHYTDEVYKFSKKQGLRKFIPVKGSSTRGNPIASFPRKFNKHGVYLTMLGTDTAKELVTDRLKITDDGAGKYHWPINDDFDELYFQHLCSEKKVRKFIKGVPVVDWVATGRNEPFDLACYNLAAIRILQKHFGVNLSKYINNNSNYVDDDPPPPPKKLKKPRPKPNYEPNSWLYP